MKEVFEEIKKWNERGYEFIFQFWGVGNNNVYIMKNDVPMIETGGFTTPEEAIQVAFDNIYKWNRTPKKERILIL